MREHMNMRNARKYRGQLLTTVSAVALTLAVCSSTDARAADADRPIIWIEGGWHFEDVRQPSDPFVPPLDALVKQGGYTSVTGLERVLDYSYGGEGSIAFQPEDSDWIFSASIRYGRAHGRKTIHEQKAVPDVQVSLFSPFAGGYKLVTATQASGYNVAGASNSETHAIVDFMAGKDVGLGLFGRDSTSTASFGVRFAQMKSTLSVNAHARPDGHFELYPENLIGILKYEPAAVFHYSASSALRESTFRGLGPSISWSNSTVFSGNIENGELALDWGINAALLFGRQRTKLHIKTKTSHHYNAEYFPSPSNTSKYIPRSAISTVHTTVTKTRSRSVSVPNVGGFAGISYRLANAKLSLGYRADFFFNAIDGGVDAAKKENRGFYGPYASISIGIGD